MDLLFRTPPGLNSPDEVPFPALSRKMLAISSSAACSFVAPSRAENGKAVLNLVEKAHTQTLAHDTRINRPEY